MQSYLSIWRGAVVWDEVEVFVLCCSSSQAIVNGINKIMIYVNRVLLVKCAVVFVLIFDCQFNACADWGYILHEQKRRYDSTTNNTLTVILSPSAFCWSWNHNFFCVHAICTYHRHMRWEKILTVISRGGGLLRTYDVRTRRNTGQ